MKAFNVGIGSRVFHAHRQDMNLNYYQHGTIMEIEQGINGGVVVKWDNCCFDVSMVPSDLAVIHNDKYTRLAMVDGLIYPLNSM